MKILWSLVGLLSICSYSYSQAVCNPDLEVNIDFPGTDITNVYSPDVEHCQLMCTQHPECLFFTFLRREWSRDNRKFYCYLKETDTGEPRTRNALMELTSGFSLKTCAQLNQTNERPCLSNVYHNTEFLGTTYKTVFVADYEECQRVCTNEPGCQFFTFYTDDHSMPSSRNKCFLFASTDVVTTPGVAAEPGLVSGFSLSSHVFPASDPDCRTVIFPDTEIPGDGLSDQPASSAEHCLAICSSIPSCTHFSFHKNDFTCYLKENVDELDATANPDYTSGLPTRYCRDNSWTETLLSDTGFAGSDIRHEAGVNDAEACQSICTDELNCQFFTYITDDYGGPDPRRRCSLKRSIVMPAPTEVNIAADAVSGFSLRNCLVERQELPNTYRLLNFVASCMRTQL